MMVITEHRSISLVMKHRRAEVAVLPGDLNPEYRMEGGGGKGRH